MQEMAFFVTLPILKNIVKNIVQQFHSNIFSKMTSPAKHGGNVSRPGI